MKPEATYPDPERATLELLETLIGPHEPDVTVSTGVPTSWTASSDPHLQVVWDGTPTLQHPSLAHCTVRIVARATSTTEAKRLAWLAHGLLCAHRGTGTVRVVLPLIGVVPARDPDTQAELAAFTVRVTVRSEPIPDPDTS